MSANLELISRKLAQISKRLQLYIDINGFISAAAVCLMVTNARTALYQTLVPPRIPSDRVVYRFGRLSEGLDSARGCEFKSCVRAIIGVG